MKHLIQEVRYFLDKPDATFTSHVQTGWSEPNRSSRIPEVRPPSIRKPKNVQTAAAGGFPRW
jgi:hypothetical protein